jgi:trimethylamine:corrinoid methyltransferase-like protein
MAALPLVLNRPPLLRAQDLERIEEAMVRLLEQTGIRVPDDALREQLAKLGFLARDDRVCIDPQTARGFLAEERKRNGDCFGPAQPRDLPREITVYVSPYPQHVHDPETDRVVPFTVERLVEATKLLDVLSERGVTSNPPGCPTDPPPALQPVMQYLVAATHSRQGRQPPDPKAEATFPYVAEMAEVLGQPIRHLPVYVFSPLTLAGESLRCVLRFRDRVSAIGVNSMPAPGSTAPIDVGDALAQAAAEVVGSVILLREVVGLPVHWHVSIHPVDLRTMAMVFGSPESALFELASRELNAYLHGAQWTPWADNMHTNAKLPGAQACAEKSSLMTLGALLGGRHFGAAGTLSLDEVFSAEQLLYDLEIKDHVERLVDGLDAATDPECCVEAVAEGVRAGGFAGLDRTLQAHREVYWHPRLFDRDFVGGWQARGSPDIRERTRALIAELIAGHTYRLAEELQAELERIAAKAKADLA